MYWLTDPGHGWLVVEMDKVRAAGIVPTKYSYYEPGRDLAYLEEDVDATAFLQAIGKDCNEYYTYESALVTREIDDWEKRVHQHGLVPFPGEDQEAKP